MQILNTASEGKKTNQPKKTQQKTSPPKNREHTDGFKLLAV